MLRVSIAGIPFGINNRYGYVERIMQDYLTADSPLFVLEATDAEIAAEREGFEGFPDEYLESTVIHRQLAERLPEYDALVFHGAVIAVDGLAYAFTAPSGTGKTTHTRLWIERLGGRAKYLNGDKPIIRFNGDTPYAYGTPWRGKERYGENISLPLAGIALVGRAESNSAASVSADDMSSALVSQIYLPRGGAAALRTLSLLDRLLGSVKLIELKCNMNTDAVDASAAAFGVIL